MYPFPLHIWFEIGAMLVGVACFRWLKDKRLRWICFFLLAIVIIELIGRYYRKILHAPNTWLYNFTIPGEFLFFAAIFYFYFQTKKYRQFALAFLIVYPFIVALNLILEGTFYLNTLNLVIGAFFIIIFCCLYLYEILRDDAIDDVVAFPMFWIVSGILLFWTGEFFYNLLFRVIRVQGVAQLAKYTKAINNNLILVLYTCISIGLIWGTLKKKFK